MSGVQNVEPFDRIDTDDPIASSVDVVAGNVGRIAEIFPDAVTENGIDFDVLRELLGDQVDDGEEKFGLNWPGKREARRAALMPSKGTLLPEPDKSVDWETTKNIFIEGDNLEVLKLLQKSYAGKVKLIYIDPPYNTGNEFVYDDDFGDGMKAYLEFTDQVADGVKLQANTDASGRKHSKWLSMIYPRLRLARDLLKQDGIIFVSIDDTELRNLWELLTQAFGEENFLACLARRTKAGGGSAAHQFAIEHDYVLAFAKDKRLLQPIFVPHDPEYAKRYAESDEHGRYFWDTMERSSTATKPYTIEAPDGAILKGKWFRSEARFKQDLIDGEVRFLQKNGGTWSVQFKQRMAEGKRIRSLLHENEFRARPEELGVMGLGEAFSFPKPVHLVKHFLAGATREDDIVMDFFAGSGTTGQAVMEQNAADGGARRYILVQLGEPAEGSEFASIPDITRTRLLRAGGRLAPRDGLDVRDLDIGFRSFVLQSSNIEAWSATPATLEEDLDLAIDNLSNGRSEQDILFELLLKLGLELTTPIEARAIAAKTLTSVGYGTLFTCLGTEITAEVAEQLGEAIIDWHAEYRTEGEVTVIFRDSGFVDDVAKLNLAEQLKQAGFPALRTI